MGKRYVFWRQPNGARDNNVESSNAPSSLLAQLGTTSFDNKGDISWRTVDVPRFTNTVATSAIIVGNDEAELNAHDSLSLIANAITAAVKVNGVGKPFSAAQFISRADALAGAFYRQSTVPYVLRTSLSMGKLPAKSIMLNGCRVTPTSKHSTIYPLATRVRRNLRGAFETHLDSSEYLRVMVTTKGRTIYEAFEKAATSLDLLRGLWTLLATRGSWSMRFSPSKARPIGIIHTGPVFTLHVVGSSVPSETYWYDPNYESDRDIYSPKSDWGVIDKSRRWACRRLRHLPYRNVLKRLLARYAEALDHTDYDVAFLKLWSVLEAITDTIGGKYDATIERAICTFSDVEIARDLLRSLRLQRNRFVHASHPGKDADQAVYGIKQFVDSHFAALLRNDFDVESLKEYGEILGLPKSVPALKERIGKLQKAVRLHSSKATDAAP
jgi:hypothetical protein